MEFIRPRFTGSVGISGSLEVTGSINILDGVYGYLYGTASYADNAGEIFPYSGSAAITGTLYITDEFILGEISGSTPFTASQVISSSAADTRLSGSFSGSFYGDGSKLAGVVSLLNISTSFGTGSVDLISQSLNLTGSQFGIVTSGSGESGSVVNFRLDDNVQISQSLYVTDNLYISGTSVSGTNIFGTASHAVSASYFDGFIGQGVTLEFLTASTTWSVVHGLNSQFPVISIWDSSSFEIIQPDAIESKGINTTEVRFTTPRTGYANVALAGAPLYQVSPFYTASFALTASFISGGVNVQDSITSSYSLTASFAVTASHIIGGTVSASFASSSLSSSLSQTASYAHTASFVNLARTASLAFTSSFNHTSSLARTASYVAAENVDGTVGTASIASIVATISGSAPSGSEVQVGSLWYDENSLMLYVRYEDPSGSHWWVPGFNGVIGSAVSSSFAITASYSETSSYATTAAISTGFTSSFLSQSTVIVNHNLNSRALTVAVYDDLHYQVIPSSVQLSDNNNAVIQFFSVESGYVVIK